MRMRIGEYWWWPHTTVLGRKHDTNRTIDRREANKTRRVHGPLHRHQHSLEMENKHQWPTNFFLIWKAFMITILAIASNSIFRGTKIEMPNTYDRIDSTLRHFNSNTMSTNSFGFFSARPVYVMQFFLRMRRFCIGLCGDGPLNDEWGGVIDKGMISDGDEESVALFSKVW